MARETDYLVKFDGDTSKLDAAVDSSGQKIDQLGNRGKASLELLDTASGGATSKLTGLASSFQSARNGAKSLNIGLKGTKAALAATGIGLFVVALGEVIANWDTITNFFKDKTIENSLSKEVNLLSEIKRKQSDNLQIAQAEGKSVEEINKLRATSLVTTSDLLKKEILLAKEQGDEETLLAKQEELRQNQLDITILQVTEETKLKNLLEDSAELLDPNLAAANERAELVAKEEEALKKINREISNITRFSETYKQNAEAAAEGSKDQQYWLDLIAKDQERLNELLPQQELLQGAINKKLEDYEQKKRDSQKKGKKKDAEEAQRQLEQELLSRQKLEDELYKAGLTTREQEELALMELYDQRIAIAGDDEGLIKAATESLTKSLEELNDKYRAEELKKEKELQDAKIALEDELYNLSLTDSEKQELALLQAYDARIAIAGDDEGLIRAATEQLNADLEKLEKERIKKERQLKQENVKANIQMASAALGALSQLNQAFAGESESDQKKAFERNKKFQVAQAIIQTGMAVTGALTAGGNPIKLATGAQFVEAAIAAATGVAQIATIKKTKFSGGSTPPPPGNSGGGATGAIPQSPQLDLGFLGGGAGQTGIRTYVVSSEVSNSQQANQRINDQASLVG